MPDSGHPEHDVVAALLRRGDRVLLCHRSPGREWFPDVWDFPGGHVERGETAEDALVREIREEVGVAIARPTSSPLAAFAAGELRLRVWLVDEWTGEPCNMQLDEHDQIGWFAFADAPGLRLADDRYLGVIERALRDPGDSSRAS